MRTPRQPSLRAALRQARAWGWPFALGVTAILAASAAALTLVPDVRQQAQAVRAEADRAARHAGLSGESTRPDRPIESAAEHFLAAFPAADARQARLATLLELAARHALEVRRGEFQLARDKESGLLRYSVTMPLMGSYAQLRGFVEDALASDVALSLDRLRLRRAAAGASAVEADLTWSFYMQPGSAALPGGAR